MKINNTIGAELELATVSTQTDGEYTMQIQGKPIRNFLLSCNNPDFHENNLGEEELSHIVEIITPECKTLPEIMGYTSRTVRSINSTLALFDSQLEAHHYPKYDLDTQNPNNLTNRGKELASIDPGWYDKLKETAVCAWQLTSSQIISELFNRVHSRVERRDELKMKKYIIALYLHLLRQMSDDNFNINYLNNDYPNRLYKTSNLLRDVKSGFPEKTEYRYNFQGKSIEEYIAFLIETTFSPSKGLDAKLAHHIYAKLKFNFQGDSQVIDFLNTLSQENYETKVNLLKANPAVTTRIIECLDFYAIEFRPFDATLCTDKITEYYQYILEASESAIRSTMANSLMTQHPSVSKEFSPSNLSQIFHPAE